MENTDLLQIAEQFGTPVYVYDSAVIKRQINRMKSAFKASPRLVINYACKANTNLNILKLMHAEGLGLDTVSIQEVQLGLKAGFKPSQIMYTPNGVSLEEIVRAADLGVILNIDNLELLEQFGHERPDYPVSVRINPHIMAGGNSKISVGHIDSKFGISIYQLPHIERVVKNTGLKVKGLHMHTGSDILDIDVFLKGAEILLDTAKHFPTIEFVDFGSGFKVPYKLGDNETDLEYLGEKLGERFAEFEQEIGNDLTLMFEPGKFLVSESGKFLVSVNVVKQTISTVFAGVDSGFNHLIRPMFYNSYHGIDNISNPEGRGRYYSVVGYICESDTFATNRKISEIREKDILSFSNAGAYCFAMASNYNSRYRPAEVLWHKGKAHLIRERETIDDILKTTVEVADL